MIPYRPAAEDKVKVKGAKVVFAGKPAIIAAEVKRATKC